MKPIQSNIKRHAAIVLATTLTALSGLAIAASSGEVTQLAAGQGPVISEISHHGKSRMQGKQGKRHGHRQHHRGLKSMLKGLDLTEEQRDRVFEIRHARMPAMRDAHKSIRAARKALRELALKGNINPDQLQQDSNLLAQAVQKMATIKAQSLSEVIAVLNEEQAAKLRERMSKGGRHHHRRHRS